jgi:hypothetical protein
LVRIAATHRTLDDSPRGTLVEPGFFGDFVKGQASQAQINHFAMARLKIADQALPPFAGDRYLARAGNVPSLRI